MASVCLGAATVRLGVVTVRFGMADSPFGCGQCLIGCDRTVLQPNESDARLYALGLKHKTCGQMYSPVGQNDKYKNIFSQSENHCP